jgi:sugar lactone lactonase YvrE
MRYYSKYDLKIITRHTALAVILSITILILSCTPVEIQTLNTEVPARNSGLVWPSPPQTPRIQYIRSIYSPSDIGVKKSWLKKAIDTIFGKEELRDILLRPYGIFVDPQRMYVTDPGIHALHVFDMKDKKYFIIKKIRKEDLISPIGITVDKNGDIYLSDSFLRKIFVFDKKGEYLREIGSSELFMRPSGIALDKDRIFVVDTHSHCVLVFSKNDGTLIFKFGKNGSGTGDFNYPTNIFIDKNDILYITDSMNFRVQVFDRDGNFISAFGKQGDGSGDFSKPKGIAVDSGGHIYIADADFDTIQIFDMKGRLLLNFGNTGRKPGEMVLPAGVFIDGQDRIYVADSYNNRVQIFQFLEEKDSRVQGFQWNDKELMIKCKNSNPRIPRGEL